MSAATKKREDEAPRVPTHLRKGDTIMVITGRERGKTGKGLQVLLEKNRAKVERLNMVKRHRKATGNSAGGIVEKEASIHLSNLQILCGRCNKPTRIAVRRTEDGKGSRYCRRPDCREAIDG